jgi:hypothetical protein
MDSQRPIRLCAPFPVLFPTGVAFAYFHTNQPEGNFSASHGITSSEELDREGMQEARRRSFQTWRRQSKES